jgi:hypothetical protein
VNDRPRRLSGAERGPGPFENNRDTRAGERDTAVSQSDRRRLGISTVIPVGVRAEMRGSRLDGGRSSRRKGALPQIAGTPGTGETPHVHRSVLPQESSGRLQRRVPGTNWGHPRGREHFRIGTANWTSSSPPVVSPDSIAIGDAIPLLKTPLVQPVAKACPRRTRCPRSRREGADRRRWLVSAEGHGVQSFLAILI